MTWSVRHEGSPRAVSGLTLPQIIVGLRDGLWEPTDEVMGPGEKTWVAIEAHPQLEGIAGEMEPPAPPSHPDETRLDMNPLIDVCLVLLVFFIMTATYAAVQEVVPFVMDKTPAAGKKGPRIKTMKAGAVKQYMVRTVARPGPGDNPDRPAIQVYWLTRGEEQSATATLADVESVLKKAVKESDKHEMLLDVANVTWGATIKIQDAAKSAKISKIYYKMSAK